MKAAVGYTRARLTEINKQIQSTAQWGNSWFEPHNEKATYLYVETNMELAGHIVRMGGITYKIFVAKCEGVRATWETQSKWEENIKMDITGCFVRTVMNTKRIPFLGQPFDYHLVTGRSIYGRNT